VAAQRATASTLIPVTGCFGRLRTFRRTIRLASLSTRPVGKVQDSEMGMFLMPDIGDARALESTHTRTHRAIPENHTRGRPIR
jgi:hypothetical protein